MKLLLKHYVVDSQMGMTFLYNVSAQDYSDSFSQQSICDHTWKELGFSSWNGKIYLRCDRCGTIKEEIPTYII